MIARFAIAASLFALAAPAAAQVVPIVQAPTVGTTLAVAAEGKVERAPDVADLSAGVMTQSKTASEAMRFNANKMTAVVAALKRAGIADRDIQTSGINLSPQYMYRENQPPLLTGYQASNNVSVRVRDIANMGKTIDALVAQGSNQINGPTFRLDKPEPALDEARVAAMTKARQRAELYAKAAGLRVKRILQISEGSAVTPPPYPVPVMRAQAMAEMKDASTPVAAGEVELSVTVNVVFELE
ncbi:SIMPL domain-containing protein [Sphingoaurantiacus capsulatus]|uniref:SIMPL domain-containing protein n=1 Tax=Sphingoaurantiacus capsulatus TaxID=1771310 RepID=A0ABV7XCI7_9SPHN